MRRKDFLFCVTSPLVILAIEKKSLFGGEGGGGGGGWSNNMSYEYTFDGSPSFNNGANCHGSTMYAHGIGDGSFLMDDTNFLMNLNAYFNKVTSPVTQGIVVWNVNVTFYSGGVGTPWAGPAHSANIMGPDSTYSANNSNFTNWGVGTISGYNIGDAGGNLPGVDSVTVHSQTVEYYQKK